MKTVAEIRDRMSQILGRPELLTFVNARLVLRTGISLNGDEKHSIEDVSRVIGALREMGYALEGQGVQK